MRVARPAKFTTEEILDAAGAAAVEHWRDATIAHVAQHVGGPVGSIYHRFPSREDVFVSLWLRAVRRFQVGIHAAIPDPDPQAAALACAVHIPRYCREHPADAVAMTLYRQADLVTSGPPGLHQEVLHVNDAASAAMSDLTERRFGTLTEAHVQLMATACLENPYGLVRRYLRSTDAMPLWLDDAVRSSTAAILSLGDSPSFGRPA